MLVVAPTGSGKTLAAFLAALDRLAAVPPPAEARKRCRVLYVSPLKALAVDVERNLRSPLTGIRQESVRLGLPEPDVRVGIRSGDTPPAERRSMATRPPDILITTPESLFLMLTSSAREALSGIETVILDEVHAVAGTKRGAHLAVSLERLDELLPRPARRIGLSATVRPVDEVARFLSPQRKVEIVQPPSTKRFDLSVVVPVEDLGELGGSPATDPDQGGQAEKPSIWPHVEERITDLVQAHRSTIVFANSRRLAERLCNRLNEIAYERATGETLSEAHSPAEIMAQSGAAKGAPALLARAHHGSVSKEQRAQVEEDLKASKLPAVVATSSLELGIDMGAVDLVVQVESPPSVASGLQRVGRAGHQVGAVSTGVVFPKYRGDLVQAAVVTERMRTGSIEALRIPSNPLDVLAQQLVAMVALDTWQVDDLLAVTRRAAPFASLPESAFTAVLDMLVGRYPSDAFAELRPRVVWDRVAGTVTGRPGAQRLAVTSGGTIPDAGSSGSSSPGPTPRRAAAGSASWTRRWCTSPGSAMSSRWAPRPGGSRTSPATGSSCHRPPGFRDGCRSGRATSWAARWNWAVPWARSSARSAECRPRTPGRGCSPPVSTPGPPTTSCRTSANSAPPAAMSPTTGPSSSSDSATSWATGGLSCTPRSARRSTLRGRWRWEPVSPSGTAWMPR